MARAKNILLRPKLEWDRIDVEPTTIPGLYTGYICILAAIEPICGAVGKLVFGYPIPFVGVWRPPLINVLAGAVVSYVLSLAMVAVLAFIIDALATTFGGQRSRVQAFKVAAYASTASWLAGVFLIVPMLGVLEILGLYSLYLLYTGLPRLMKTPPGKALAYTALVIVAAVVLFIIIGMVATPLSMIGYSRPAPAGTYLPG